MISLAGLVLFGMVPGARAVDNESELVTEIDAANDSETDENGGENSNVRTINVTSDFAVTGGLPTATQSLSLRGSGQTVTGGTLNVVDSESLRLGENFTWDGLIFVSGAGSELIVESGTVVTSANGNDEADLIIDADSNLTISAGYWDSFTDFTSIELRGDVTVTLDTLITLEESVSVTDGTLTFTGDNLLQPNERLTVGANAEIDFAGTNQSIGSFSGSGDIDLGNNAGSVLTIGGDDTDTAYAGEIVGDGGITKVGDGNLTLSGELDYLGDTRVDEGELTLTGILADSDVFVEDGGTLILSDSNPGNSNDNVENNVVIEDGGILYANGTGTIGGNLTNRGTIDYEEGGAGTVVVAGDYTQDSSGTLLVDVGLDGSAGLVEVEGAASLAGTLELVTGNNEENFNPSTEYVLLTAEDGITGEWDTIVEDFAFLDVSVVYQERDENDGDGEEALLTLLRNDLNFIDVAETSNQAAVAGALTAVVGSAEDELASILGIIEGLNADDTRDAYDALAGAPLATTGTATVNAVQFQTNFLMDRLTSGLTASQPLLASNPGESAIVLASAQDQSDSLWPKDLAEQRRNVPPPPSAQAQATATRSHEAGSQFTPWALLYGGTGELESDDTSGLDYDRQGFLAGVDFPVADGDWRAGVTVGYETSEMNYQNGTGDNDIDSFYLGGYARRAWGDYQFTGTLSLGIHDYESTRNVDVGGSTGIGQADYDSYSGAISLELSRPFITAEGTYLDQPTAVVEPFVRVSYASVFQDSYKESGLGTAGLDVDSEVLDSFRVGIGARGEWRFWLFETLETTVRGRALVNFAVIDEQTDLDVAFVDTPGSSFAIEGSEQDDVFGVLGVGVSFPISDNGLVFIDFDQQIGDETTGSVISGGVRLQF